MKNIVLLLIVTIGFIGRVQAQEREIVTSDSVKLYVKVKGTGILKKPAIKFDEVKTKQLAIF